MTTSNPKPRVMSGITAERPSNPELGTFFYDTTLSELFLFTSVGGVRVWVAEGGAGILPDYWVAPAGTIPAARFNTIGAATAQFKIDGHSAAVPGTIFVLPGTYVEDVTIPDGCDLVGMGGKVGPLQLISTLAIDAWPQDVIIQGQVFLDALFTTGTIQGFHVTPGAAKAALSLGALGGYNLCVRQCEYSVSGATPCMTAAPATAAKLEIDSSRFNSATSGQTLVNITTANLTVLAVNCSLRCNSGADTALSSAGGLFVGRLGFSLGAFVQTAPCTWQFEDWDATATGATVGLTLNTTGTCGWTRGSFFLNATAGATYAVGAGGFLGLDGRPKTDTTNGIGGSIGAGGSAKTDGWSRQFTEVDLGAANKAVATGVVDADLYTFDCTAADRTLTLPPHTSVPIGTTYRTAKVATGAHSIIVAPNGADLINGANAPVTSTVTLFGHVDVVNGTAGWFASSYT